MYGVSGQWPDRLSLAVEVHLAELFHFTLQAELCHTYFTKYTESDVSDLTVSVLPLRYSLVMEDSYVRANFPAFL